MAQYLCDSIVNKAWKIHQNLSNLGWMTCVFNSRIVWHNTYENSTNYPIISFSEEKDGNFSLMRKKKAEEYPTFILQYYVHQVAPYTLSSVYKYYSEEEIKRLLTLGYSNMDRTGVKLLLLNPMNSYRLLGVENREELSLKIKGKKELHTSETIDSLVIVNQEISLIISQLYEEFQDFQNCIKTLLDNLRCNYEKSDRGVCNYINFLLSNTLFGFEFPKHINSEYRSDDKSIVIDYTLPSKGDIPTATFTKLNKPTVISISKQRKLYDDIVYAIVIRSLAEIFHYDVSRYINHICFNGKIKDRSPITGQMEEKYILSINVSREQIESLNLEFIDPKECFKYLKGVSASKLYEQTEIRPIITPSFSDKRIVKARQVDTAQSTNLAEMDWEEFEHLVRQVFEWEFSDKGGEVNVTQSSRDGGVDAIVFDPDPIRGGKIIIQAKRYTNTVPVSAVRDLYGTIINEGANKGILITTSDYGPDSYKFAQGKPITLLNGGHLLYLMEKHGRHARIDIQEAKNKNKGIN